MIKNIIATKKGNEENIRPKDWSLERRGYHSEKVRKKTNTLVGFLSSWIRFSREKLDQTISEKERYKHKEDTFYRINSTSNEFSETIDVKTSNQVYNIGEERS